MNEEHELEEDDPLKKDIERGNNNIRHNLLNKYNVFVYNKHDEIEKVNCVNLAKLVLLEHKYHFISIQDDTTASKEIFYYKNGYYHNNGKNLIKTMVNHYLDNMTTKSRKAEVIDYIIDEETVSRYDLEPDVNLICVKNGIFNLQTDKLIPHSHEYRFLNQLPVVYDKDAKCPKIMKFFKDVFPNKGEGSTYQKQVDLVQEMFGYCLYRAYKYHVAFLLYGAGSNGKSICTNLIRHLIGEGNYSGCSLHSLDEDQFSRAYLYGKLVNLGPEVSGRALKETATFKTLTGNEATNARKLFHGPFNFVNYAKLVFSTNNIPYSPDKSYGFMRRWIIIIFAETFLEGEKRTDPNILDKLTTEEELSGLFNWSLEGLRRLLKREQFSYTDSDEERVDMYETMSRPDKRFIVENLELENGEGLKKDDVYDCYEKWCICHRFPILTKQTFSQSLKRYVPGMRMGEIQELKKRFKAYKNIRWRDDSDFAGIDFHSPVDECRQTRVDDDSHNDRYDKEAKEI